MGILRLWWVGLIGASLFPGSLAADPPAEPDRLLGPPVTTGVIVYAVSGVTYIPSDMGPDEATLPEAAVAPGRGVWLADPGDDLASWRLRFFDSGGNPGPEFSLNTALSLRRPNEFVPATMEAVATGGVSLVGSRSFDFDNGAPGDFVLARFDESGSASRPIILPAIEPSRGVRVIDDRVFTYPIGFGGAWNRWEDGRLAETPHLSSGEDAAVKVGGYLMSLVNPTELLVVDGEKAGLLITLPLPLRGRIPVDGEGTVFGFIRICPSEPTELGTTVENRVLEVLELVEDGSVVFRGSAMLPPNRYERVSSDTDFAIHRAGEAGFDAEGHLFDLEWTPNHVRLVAIPAIKPGIVTASKSP